MTCTVIAASILVLGIIIGKAVFEPEEFYEIKAESGLEWADVEGTLNYKYLVPNGEDGFKYFASMDIPGVGEGKEFEITNIEYKILDKGDLVNMHCIWDTEGPSYVKFERDERGCINIIDSRPIVVVDPGHGGINLGGGSNYLWDEKDMNLKMSLLMKDLLEDSGMRVIMTRTRDEYVPLYDRCEISNYVEADLFISNHINLFNSKACGVEVLYSLKSDGDFATDLAHSIASVGMEIWDIRYRRDDDLPAVDYYFVHEYNDSDSYIIEYGFADNEGDVEMIVENWETMVENASSTIIAYVDGHSSGNYAILFEKIVCLRELQ